MTRQSVSQSVITKLLPVEHMVHYTHSVFSECVAESQSQGGLGALAYASPSDFLHLAEARGLRLGSQRCVDGGVGAHRRSTPGAHQGMGHRQGRRGRGRLAVAGTARRRLALSLYVAA